MERWFCISKKRPFGTCSSPSTFTRMFSSFMPKEIVYAVIFLKCGLSCSCMESMSFTERDIIQSIRQWISSPKMKYRTKNSTQNSTAETPENPPGAIAPNCNKGYNVFV